MNNRQRFADMRLLGRCVHCGGPSESVDHTPSKVFLDEPYPPNLHAVECCLDCNRGFSKHEEYVACLIDCVLAGSAEPSDVGRPKVQAALRKSAQLKDRIARSKRVIDERTFFEPESESLRIILLKLARGHSAFENSETRIDDPSSIAWVALEDMSEQARGEFEAVPGDLLLPEVGSRSFEEAIVNGGVQWMVVQPGRYRFLVTTTRTDHLVRFVLSEYLACEVTWEM